MTLRWVPGWNGLTEPEAVSYVAAVEAADGQELEFGVAKAINDFVLGCKNDGIWDAIKASCILAGARTLDGALVPLAGTDPIKLGTEAGWNYNRETGLKGNGVDNYLNANFPQNSVGQDNHHMTAWMSSQIDGFVIGSSPAGSTSPGDGLAPGAAANTFRFRSRYPGAGVETDFGDSTILGFIGASRSSSTGFTARTGGANTAITISSAAPDGSATHIFRRPLTASPVYASSRIAFYSLGETLDLALLDARVSALITAIGAAIP